MEIVKEPGKTYTCRGCGCELKITEKKDIRYGLVGYLPTIFGLRKAVFGHYIVCPFCAAQIRLDTNEE